MKNLDPWLDNLRKLDQVPYHHQQCSEFGVDCIGLVLQASLMTGYDIRSNDVPDRLPDANDDTLERIVSEVGTPINDAEIGSLIIIRLVDWNFYKHCGVRLSETEFIHADRDAGKVCIIPFRSAYTKKGIVKFFRMPFINAN